MSKLKETELAEAVIAWLEEYGWDVYQEVQIYAYGARADIVAVQNNLVYVVECKTTLSLAVLDQAWYWSGRAHYVSVAVPKYKNKPPRGRVVAERFLRDYGMGLIEVSNIHGDRRRINEHIGPSLCRKAQAYRIREGLCDLHKTYAKAGNAEGKFLTPFKETCMRLRSVVDSNPGMSLKEFCENNRTHYATPNSARASLTKWIEMGRVEGVKIRRHNRKIHVYPAE